MPWSCAALEKQLRVHGIYRLTYEELEPPEKKYCAQYFKNSVAPIISPQIVDTHHPFPHLKNNLLHVGAWVKYKGREFFGVIPLPDSLPPVLFLPGGELRYLPLEELLTAFLSESFPKKSAEAFSFCHLRTQKRRTSCKRRRCGVSFFLIFRASDKQHLNAQHIKRSSAKNAQKGIAFPKV